VKCPECGRVVLLGHEHAPDCLMVGMTLQVSSLMYGWPICQCCFMFDSPERMELHETRAKYGTSLVELFA
jgi:hypothetical protein